MTRLLLFSRAATMMAKTGFWPHRYAVFRCSSNRASCEGSGRGSGRTTERSGLLLLLRMMLTVSNTVQNRKTDESAQTHALVLKE